MEAVDLPDKDIRHSCFRRRVSTVLTSLRLRMECHRVCDRGSQKCCRRTEEEPESGRVESEIEGGVRRLTSGFPPFHWNALTLSQH